jgi:hypothetical protein
MYPSVSLFTFLAIYQSIFLSTDLLARIIRPQRHDSGTAELASIITCEVMDFPTRSVDASVCNGSSLVTSNQYNEGSLAVG